MTQTSLDKSNLNRREVIGGAAALALVPGVGFAQGAAPRKGGILTMALWPDPTALVSGFSTSDQILVVSSKMTEGLLTYGYDFAPQPKLATSWEISPDGRTFTFKLRPGVKWHDGKDFTSDDVAFTIMQLLKVNHPRGRLAFANVTAVETPDPLTAVIRASKPSPMIINALAGYESPMMPKHIYETGEPLKNPANLAPVGTGPFKFVEWVRGSHIILERNPNYWDPGKPHLDRIVMRILNDASARSAALESGEILLAGPNPIPYSEIGRYKTMSQFVVETRGEELLTHGQALEINLRNPDLAKLDVRKAIYHAINRDTFAKAVWYEAGRPATSPMPYQAGDLVARELPAYPYDPKKAEELLEAAGYPRTGPNRTRLKLRLDWVPLGEVNLRSAEFIKQSLQRVGIEVSIRSSDLPTYLKLVYGDYDYDMSVFLYTPTHDASLGLARFYWSKSAKPGAPFVISSGYASPQMDKILEDAAAEPDTTKRRQLFWDFQKLAMVDLPLLPLIDLDYAMIFAKKLQGVVASPEGLRGSFADVWLDA